MSTKAQQPVCQNIKIPCGKLSSDLEIAFLGFGTSRAAGESAELLNAVKTALKCGYRLFDTAWVNFNDSVFNRVLLDLDKNFNGEIKRKDLFIVSKLWNTHHSPEMVRKAVNDTLKNIGTDYIDLYLMHWPMAFKESLTDPFPKKSDGTVAFSDVNYVETYKAMEELVKNGTVKNIGVCNFNIKQLEDLMKNCDVKPAVNQIEVHPYLQNDKLVDFCRNNGIHVMTYSSLGAVDIAEAKEDVPNLLEDETIKKIAQKYKKTPAQVCIRWCLNRGLHCIPMSLQTQQICDNANVFDFKLDDQDMQEIKKLNKNLRINNVLELKNHPFYPFTEE
jgi:diketogulonate reductase-like aldo/keto reductase